MAPTAFSDEHSYILNIQFKGASANLHDEPPVYVDNDPSSGRSTSSVYFPMKLESDLSVEGAISKLGIATISPLLSVQEAEIRLYKVMGSTISKPEFTPSKNSPYLVSISMSPSPSPPEIEADFNVWYDQEHIDLLSKVPQWKAGRRFVLVDHATATIADSSKGSPGDNPRGSSSITLREENLTLTLAKPTSAGSTPPKYLAIHAFSDLDGFDTPEYTAATNTPWRTKVMEGIVQRERLILRLAERE